MGKSPGSDNGQSNEVSEKAEYEPRSQKAINSLKKSEAGMTVSETISGKASIADS